MKGKADRNIRLHCMNKNQRLFYGYSIIDKVSNDKEIIFYLAFHGEDKPKCTISFLRNAKLNGKQKKLYILLNELPLSRGVGL